MGNLDNLEQHPTRVTSPHTPTSAVLRSTLEPFVHHTITHLPGQCNNCPFVAATECHFAPVTPVNMCFTEAAAATCSCLVGELSTEDSPVSPRQLCCGNVKEMIRESQSTAKYLLSLGICARFAIW